MKKLLIILLVAISFNFAANAQESKYFTNPTVGLMVSSDIGSKPLAVPQITFGIDLLDERITANAKLGGHLDVKTAENEYYTSDTFAGLNVSINFPNRYITPYVFMGASTYFATAYDVLPNYGAGLKRNVSVLTIGAQYELMFDKQYASLSLSVRL